MTITLRRHRRRQSAVCVPPVAGHCTCTVHYPVTAEERALVEAVMATARRDGDLDLLGYLQTRLDTPCRSSAGVTVADGILCDCGCGRRPWEHNPNILERSAA